MIRDFLEQALAQRGSNWQDFSELTIRLMDYGVICRDESRKEAELYDRYLQLADLVGDYLAVMDIRLLHERRFQSLRLFPPGSEVPGLADAESAFNSGLRQRLNYLEVALVLVLRAEYDKALREGNVDENGNVLLSLEALNLAFKNLLSRPLPESIVERRNLFRRLRQLRLIRLSSDEDLDNTEAWLTIRPGITSMVTDTVLNLLTSPEGLKATDTVTEAHDDEEEETA